MEPTKNEKLVNEGRTLIGKGSQATIFRCADGSVVKVFKPRLQHLAVWEYHCLVVMKDLGFKVPSPLALSKVDGIAIKMEYIAGDCLGDQLWSNTVSPFDAGFKVGSLHARLHGIQAVDALRSKSNNRRTAEFIFSQGIQSKKEDTDADTLQQLLVKYASQVVACHGDFHPSNIVVSASDLFVLDWCDAFLGPAESDIATTLVRIRSVPSLTEGQPEQISRFCETLHVFESGYLTAYDKCRKLDRSAVKEWVRIVAEHTKAREGRKIKALDELIAGLFSLQWPEITAT